MISPLNPNCRQCGQLMSDIRAVDPIDQDTVRNVAYYGLYYCPSERCEKYKVVVVE